MKKLLLLTLVILAVGCVQKTTERIVTVDSSVVKDACYLNLSGKVVAAHAIVAVIPRTSMCRGNWTRIDLANGDYVFVDATPEQVLTEMEKCKDKLGG